MTGMNQPLLQEIRLKNFRCFYHEQIARLASLTLLVGDNSTGKTSFLAALRAAWEIGHQYIEPDFRQPPYDLGSFSDIAHSSNNQDSFEIGLVTTGFTNNPFRLAVTFRPQVVEPTPVLLTWYRGNLWIKCTLMEAGDWRIEFGSSRSSWRLEDASVRRHLTNLRPLLRLEIERLYDLRTEDDVVTRISGPLERPDEQYVRQLDDFVMDIAHVHRRSLFASSAIRSRPLRTYDHTRPTPDPEGAYVPSYFASVQMRNQEQWCELKSKMEEFGQASGLFDEIFLNRLGTSAASPFQMEIRRQGGPRRNLIDVGYGVSQALPVIAELFRPEGPSVFLLQQPEVHLHPSAQAALGSLFCSTARSGRQLIVETHSDYIVDRILLDIRDKRTHLRPDDVSILYFESEDTDVAIHSIHIDDEGNVLDAPDGYRSFFKKELQRVIDY